MQQVARNRDSTWLQLASGTWIWAPLVDRVPIRLPVVAPPTPVPLTLTPEPPAPVVSLPANPVPLSAGFNFTCGVRTDSTLACWGADSEDWVLPDITLTAVSADFGHLCLVWEDLTLFCTGAGDSKDTGEVAYGQAIPPDGTFTAVSAGGFHTCGVRTDGTLACWGDNDLGQATPTGGTFTTISAGFAHTCGVRTDGTLVGGLQRSGLTTGWYLRHWETGIRLRTTGWHCGTGFPVRSEVA